MESNSEERSGFAGGVARMLNAGGKSFVVAYDATSVMFSKVFSAVKKSAVLPEKAAGMFTKGLGLVAPSEVRQMEKKIRNYEKQIKELYFEIGREGAKVSEAGSPLESVSVKNLISDVREYEKEIERLKKGIAAFEEEKKAHELRKMEVKKSVEKGKEKPEKVKIPDEKLLKDLEAAIKKAVKAGDFNAQSEQEIFSKVAHDLLDNETEIKCLAAAELGKIGNAAAVPVLIEAARSGDPDLMSEIINSLISIGDERAVPLFKAEADSPRYRVRIGCLRGLYKLAGDPVAMPVLMDALRDDHPEVRRTAVTFIGWKDYREAVSAVIQCLRDEEVRVRKAAVSALANLKDDSSMLPLIKTLGDDDLETREKAFEAVKIIAGEEIAFDVHASGKALSDAIQTLRNWWQKERLGKETETEIVDMDAPVSAAIEETAVKTEEAETAVETEEAETAVETEEAETAVKTEEVETAVETEETAVETEEAETAVETEETEEADETEEAEEADETGEAEEVDETEEAEEADETGETEETDETEVK